MSKVEAEHDFFSFAFRCRHPSDDDGSREAAARIIFGETKALCHHGEIIVRVHSVDSILDAMF